MRLLLVSLDGLWEKDYEMLQLLPNIGRLIRNGVSCKQVKTIYPALTYPVHTTLLTGCTPAQHGIGHNQPLAPSVAPDMRPWYWESRLIQRPTLHQLLQERGWKTASILWPVTGKSRYIRWNFPEVLALPGENQTLKMLRYGTAFWILLSELRWGRQRKSVRQPDLDDYAALLGEKLLQSRRPPDFLSIHFVDCDEMRHHYGADSREASEAILRLDSRIGRLLSALRASGMEKDTVISLVSDHGLADIRQKIVLEEELLHAELLHLCQVQSTGMGAYLFPAKGEADNFFKVKAFLTENTNRLGIARVYSHEELQQMGAVSQVCLAVEALPGIAFEDMLTKEKREQATHGFGPDHPAAQCLWILSGPSIQTGQQIDAAHMEDIAPTLMDILGYEMPSAFGRAIKDITNQ